MPRSTPEWIGATPDTPIPQRVKTRIVDRQDGKCFDCFRGFCGKTKPEFDHRPALINGGENRESKIEAVCKDCHLRRTGQDVAAKAKTARMKAARYGIYKPPSRLARDWQRFKEWRERKKLGMVLR